MPPAAIIQTKASHLIVEELNDELVVFDRRTNRAHLLDARASAIYRAARDGCSIGDLAAQVVGGTPEARLAVAQRGVAELERAGLLVGAGTAMPRRGLLKTLGAAGALPMVISIVAPAPAAAATVGDPCNSSADCNPLLVCSGCVTAAMGVCQLCIPNLAPAGGACNPAMNSCLCCSLMCDDDGFDFCE